MQSIRRLAVSCLFALLVAGPVLARDEVRVVPFAGWVELDADGRLAGFAPAPESRVPEVLLEPLVAQVRAMKFVPATLDGRPAASRSWLQGAIRLVPDGDEYVMRLEDARLDPRPVEFARMSARNRRASLAMVVAYRVRPDGSTIVDRVEPLGASEPEVLQAAATMIGGTRYEPEQVDGVAVETPMLMPLQMHRGRSEPEPVVPPAMLLPAGRPGVAGQDAYEPLFVVTRVRKRGVAPLQTPVEPGRQQESAYAGPRGEGDGSDPR